MKNGRSVAYDYFRISFDKGKTAPLSVQGGFQSSHIRTKGRARVLTSLCQVKQTELISFPGILKKDYMLLKSTFYPTREKNLTNKWLMKPKKVLSPGLVTGHKWPGMMAQSGTNDF